ncbi:MAG: LolA family protein [Phycisphaerales bacterium]
MKGHGSTLRWIGVLLGAAGATTLAQPPSTPAPTPPATEPVASAPPLDPTLRARLEDIDRRAQDHADLRAEFEQRKHTPLLRRPIVSSGTVKARKGVALWETTKPRPTTMRIDEREIAIYDPAEKAMEVFPADEGVRKLAATPQPSLGSVLEQFDVVEVPAADLDPAAKGELVALSMTPRDEALRRRVARVRVLLDVARALCLRMEITDAEGDRTEIAFKKIEVGVGLTDESLALVVSRGTAISRPLDGLAPGGGR